MEYHKSKRTEVFVLLVIKHNNNHNRSIRRTQESKKNAKQRQYNIPIESIKGGLAHLLRSSREKKMVLAEFEPTC